MTVTDMQVLDLLESLGSTTAGQLADLTGLTTGAVTGMLNRLEEAGLVRRERDPNDGRRVIVRLEKSNNEQREIGSVFAGITKAWDELASRYSDEQLAFLLEFVQRSSTLSRQEIVRLREVPSGERGDSFAPLEEIASGRLVVASGISTLSVRADAGIGDLYRANFQGAVPSVTVKDGVVTIRYPRRLLGLVGEQREAEVKLNTAIPWHITIQGGASEVDARLGSLNLVGLEVKGGLSTINLELPVPPEVVPIRISGGASEIKIRRPAGVPVRVHLKGWASSFVFDDQTFSNVGSNVWQQSTNFDPAVPYFDIEVASSVSSVTITAG
jgi:DNA-binding MarR family transcriptional regulator